MILCNPVSKTIFSIDFPNFLLYAGSVYTINEGEPLMEKREKFSSRLGFILISAGCAVGLGNVWRFPYITGKYGGAAFVLIYLVFLVILGLPIMVMEFSVGRSSQKSAARSFHALEPAGTKWHFLSYIAIAGNYLLMMFYTTVGGWMLSYVVKMIKGEFTSLDPDAVGAGFNNMLTRPGSMAFWMILTVVISFLVCSLGLQKGVERITKFMMGSLFVILIILCIRSVTLPGAADGAAFYLIPDFSKIKEYGWFDVIFAAMGQAFFTLSLGIGAMAIFGSYIAKDHTLTGESIRICLLDTLVALLAGLIIFPACFAFKVNPGEGPGLVFVTLPNIFNQMAGGRIFGTLFFVFMSFAALSTIIAVFENIISFSIDLFSWKRGKAVAVNLVLIIVLSLPCVFGFNIWSSIAPLGAGSTIQDLEDFIVSNNLLPLGSLGYLLFCTSRYGWGWKNFIAEADAGNLFGWDLRFFQQSFYDPDRIGIDFLRIVGNPAFLAYDLPMGQIGPNQKPPEVIQQDCFRSLRALVDPDEITRRPVLSLRLQSIGFPARLFPVSVHCLSPPISPKSPALLLRFPLHSDRNDRILLSMFR